MSSVERLPPDQRAVLTLVLQRGKTYEDIANLLFIRRAAVRDRALSALDALAPSQGVSPERRALITDYLLGQLPDSVRAEVRERLARSASERAWAQEVASELSPMSSQPWSEIPPAGEDATEEEPVSAGFGSPPELGAAPTAAEAGDGGGTAAGAAGAGAPAPVPARRSSSRGGGGILLALAALVVVVVVIIILVTNGSSSPKKSGAGRALTPTTSSTTTATSTTPSGQHVIAEIALRPAARGSKAAGVAEVVTEGKVTGVVVAADHLTPNGTHNAYAVWLSNPTGAPSKLLGYVSPGVGKNGDLKTSGPLPSNVARYKELLVTLETTSGTTTPGPIVLSGPLTLKSG